MTITKKTNTYYYGNDARRDYFANLRALGKPLRVIELSENNGHVCEEMPICRHPAAVTLVFAHEIVNLCKQAHDRYRGKNEILRKTLSSVR